MGNVGLRARSMAVLAAVLVVLTGVLTPGVATAQTSTSSSGPAASAATPTPTPTPAPTPTPTETPAPPITVHGYYRTPWTTDPRIYRTRTDGSVTALSREQWKAAGSPRLRILPVEYGRATWSPQVYALIIWPDGGDDRRVDKVVALDRASFVSAGSPKVRLMGHVPTTRYLRYQSGPGDLYARTPDGKTKKMTSAERSAAGSPRADRVIAGGWYRAVWSPAVHFVRPDGSHRVITADEYRRAGKPHVARAPVVYAKTSWSPVVYGLVSWPTSDTDRTVDTVEALSAAEFARAGRPKVTVRPRIPGDSFVRLSTGSSILHRMKGYFSPVTTAQWRSAGSPKVTTVAPAKPMHIRGILIVNKSIPLPSSYGNGLRPELTSAWSRMRADAKKDGISLSIISGFRSYASQQSVFASKVRQHGRAEAERRSARPGHSEHQTGLAIDVNSISQSWGETRAGRWVAANAHRYGFIVRYPKGKEKVTGYRWEPWHLRYVGTGTATHLKKTGLTLDEYLGVTSRY
ncbi:M15 family metallopeptidase [Microbacterium oleivorans]|uniref:M15 family metallopeptidase n=1 Tax=Microbacterium oleivorans TaxID=273677 RepID=UPI0020403104|nr:M15 family metallopeptidase [Microbacterium oleivorans]MCM3697382.1 M15 family metallopeptidase [Microbacterium oleivorans]